MNEAKQMGTEDRLLTNKRFLALLGGQGISYLGDAIASVALPLLVIGSTGSGFLMGVVGMLEQAPLFVIGLPAGVWVDRWDRRRTMLCADFGRAFLMALIPAAALLHVAVMPVVFMVALASGALGVFFGAAYTGSIPSVVRAEQVGRANGYFEAIESAAYLMGPPIAGLLTGAIGPAATMGLDALSFLASAGAILCLPEPVTSQRTRNFLTELRQGVDIVLRDPFLQAITVLWGLNRLLFTALIPALIFLMTKTFQDSPVSIGVAVGVYAFGSLVGTLLLPSRIPVVGHLWVAICGQALMAAGALLIYITSLYGMILMGAVLLGLGEGIVLVFYLTCRVVRVPEEALGRVYSLTSIFTQGMGALGFLVVGAFLSSWGGRITWALLSILALLTLFIPLIRYRSQDHH